MEGGLVIKPLIGHNNPPVDYAVDAHWAHNLSMLMQPEAIEWSTTNLALVSPSVRHEVSVPPLGTSPWGRTFTSTQVARSLVDNTDSSSLDNSAAAFSDMHMTRQQSWLSAMCSNTFFESCNTHAHVKKNETTFFCVTCASGPLCSHCLSQHRGHELLQIRRYVYRDVIRLSDISTYIDADGMQTYIVNQAKVIFLRPDPKQLPNSTACPGACITCRRNVREGAVCCSLACKLATLTAPSARTRSLVQTATRAVTQLTPVSSMVHGSNIPALTIAGPKSEFFPQSPLPYLSPWSFCGRLNTHAVIRPIPTIPVPPTLHSSSTIFQARPVLTVPPATPLASTAHAGFLSPENGASTASTSSSSSELCAAPVPLLTAAADAGDGSGTCVGSATSQASGSCALRVLADVAYAAEEALPVPQAAGMPPRTHTLPVALTTSQFLPLSLPRRSRKRTAEIDDVVTPDQMAPPLKQRKASALSCGASMASTVRTCLSFENAMDAGVVLPALLSPATMLALRSPGSQRRKGSPQRSAV